MKPQRLAVEEQEHDVGERTRAEAATDGQMHDVAQAPPLPLAVVELGRDRREPVTGAPAAAAGGAHEELAAEPRDVDHPAVGPGHQIALPLVHRAQRAPSGRRTSATPISASRVIWAARASSSRRSAPAGAIGSTM